MQSNHPALVLRYEATAWRSLLPAPPAATFGQISEHAALGNFWFALMAVLWIFTGQFTFTATAFSP